MVFLSLARDDVLGLVKRLLRFHVLRWVNLREPLYVAELAGGSYVGLRVASSGAVYTVEPPSDIVWIFEFSLSGGERPSKLSFMRVQIYQPWNPSKARYYGTTHVYINLYRELLAARADFQLTLVEPKELGEDVRGSSLPVLHEALARKTDYPVVIDQGMYGVYFYKAQPINIEVMTGERLALERVITLAHALKRLSQKLSIEPRTIDGLVKEARKRLEENPGR